MRLPIDELLDEVITLRGSNFTTVKERCSVRARVFSPSVTPGANEDLVQLKNQLVRELRKIGQRRQLLG